MAPLAGQGDCCHSLAGFGATPAELRAFLHLCVICEALAIDGASLADFGAGTAGKAMQGRSSNHEIGTGLADFGTVEQQTNVRRLSVLAAHVQTVRGRFQADAVAV
jgi:hypothetical protein